MTGIGNQNVTGLTWATDMVPGGWLPFDIGPTSLAASCLRIASLVVAVPSQRQPLCGTLLRALLLGATFRPARWFGRVFIVGGGI